MNKFKSAAAAEILQYEYASRQQRLIVLRDPYEIRDGTFRDIDLYTRSFCFNSFKNWLKELDYVIVKEVERYKFTQVCIWAETHQVFILLDIWNELTYKGIPYFDHSIIEECDDELLFFCLPVEMSLRISVVKCLTQNSTVKPKYINRIDQLDLDISSLKAETLLTNPQVGATEYCVRKIGWLYSFIKSIKKSKFMCIYLLGPDGAGKTTISNVLAQSQMRASVEYYHGRMSMLPRLSILARKKIHKVAYNDSKKRKFTIVHALYYTIDSLFARLYLCIQRYRDKLVIFDRTHYDICARESYRNVPTILQKVLISSLYRPQICILLCADPEEINERKPELPVFELEKQYAAYQSNSKLLRFTKIGTSINDKSISQIVNLIEKS